MISKTEQNQYFSLANLEASNIKIGVIIMVGKRLRRLIRKSQDSISFDIDRDMTMKYSFMIRYHCLVLKFNLVDVTLSSTLKFTCTENDKSMFASEIEEKYYFFSSRLTESVILFETICG